MSEQTVPFGMIAIRVWYNQLYPPLPPQRYMMHELWYTFELKMEWILN